MANYTNKVMELNPKKTPMIETHFYKWMESGGYLDNRIDTKVNYLQTLGFVKGVDKVSEDCLNMLNFIIRWYYMAKSIEKREALINQ